MEKHKLAERQIINEDKTGISALEPKGQEQARAATSRERRRNVTGCGQ